MNKDYATEFASEIIRKVRNNHEELRYIRLTSQTGVLTDLDKEDVVRYQIWLGQSIGEGLTRGVKKILGYGKNRNLKLEEDILSIKRLLPL